MSLFHSHSFINAVEKIPRYIDKCFSRMKDPKDEWPSNVVVIIGERGAGKSTVLNKVLQKMSPKVQVTDSSDNAQQLREYLVLEPLDCSQLPPEIPLGLAVLVHLKRNVKLKPIFPELEILIQSFCRFHDKYSDLCLNLSNSAEEFGSYLSKGVGERLSVKKEIGEMLSNAQERNCFSNGIVVPLDDFDLIPKSDHKKWFRSLLDELHQTRMVFLVTADFHRLQYQSYGDKVGDDLKTGHAIVNKLFPPANRFWLKTWSLTEANAYPVSGDRSLKNLLKTQGTTLKLPFPLLYQFIPSLPRGWHGVLSRLEEWADPSENQERTITELLALIANCREEVLLARKLQDLPIEAWIDDLPLFSDLIDQPTWEELVETARERVTSALCPIRSLPNFLKPEQTQSNESSYKHDPKWGPPLRRDDYYQFPLRDAVKSAPYWAELLIDIGLSAELGRSTYRNRLKLINRWQVLSTRFDKAQFEICFDKPFLLEYFSSKANPPYRAGLFWFEQVTLDPPVDDGSVNLAFGWPVLMRRLACDDPFQMALRESLCVGTEALKGEAPDLSDGKLYDFLPDQVWSFVLLADGLTRCPWSALSAYRNWQVPVYIGLAVAFVRSAYVYALAELDPNFACSDQQKRLVSVLKTQDFMNLTEQGESGLIQILQQIFSDPLDQTVSTHEEARSLRRALNAFLASPLYRQVVDHFNRHTLFTNRLTKALASTAL